MWNTILFDLDGTLTDSADGIAASVQTALRKIGIDEPDVSKLRCFVGPPLHAYFMEYAGLTSERALEAVQAYREDYASRGMFINSVYPMIPELLFELKRNRKKLAVVTSKETSQATRILQQFGLLRYFDAVVGCTPDNTNMAKEFLIEQALRTLGNQYDRAGAVMVGDRFYDIEGAKAAGVASIGVSYGYGSTEELENCGSDYIAENPGELGRLLLDTGKAPFNSGYPTTGRKIWNVMMPILLWLLVTNAVTMIGSAFYGIYYGTQNVIPDDPQLLVDDIISRSYLIAQYLTAVADVILIPILFRMWKKDEQFRSAVIQTLRTIRRPGFLNGLLALLMGFGFSAVINIGIEVLGLNEWMYEMNPSRYDSLNVLPFWAQCILLCILAPVIEELLFRGLVFRRLRDYTGMMTAALCSAAIFGLVHFDIITGISAFVIGIIMAVMYEYTDSVITPILFHFGFNFFAIFITLAGLDAAEGTARTIAFIVALAAGAVFSGVSALIFFRKNRG